MRHQIEIKVRRIFLKTSEKNEDLYIDAEFRTGFKKNDFQIDPRPPCATKREINKKVNFLSSLTSIWWRKEVPDRSESYFFETNVKFCIDIELLGFI